MRCEITPALAMYVPYTTIQLSDYRHVTLDYRPLSIVLSKKQRSQTPQLNSFQCLLRGQLFPTGALKTTTGFAGFMTDIRRKSYVLVDLLILCPKEQDKHNVQ